MSSGVLSAVWGNEGGVTWTVRMALLRWVGVVSKGRPMPLPRGATKALDRVNRRAKVDCAV